MDEYDGCFHPYSRGPCPKGKEVQPLDGIGICSVTKNTFPYKKIFFFWLSFKLKCFELEAPRFCAQKDEFHNSNFTEKLEEKKGL